MKILSPLPTILAGCLFLLSGCGGGDSEPEVPSYAVADAFRARLTSGSEETFAISGDCNGTAKFTSRPAERGVNGYIIRREQSASFPESSAPPVALLPCSGGTWYWGSIESYDANFSFVDADRSTYSPFGSISAHEYIRRSTVSQALPAKVRPGDEGTYATYLVFRDPASVSGPAGRYVESYKVMSDTSTSVLIQLKSTAYLGEWQPFARTETYRLGIKGDLTLLTIEVQDTDRSDREGVLNLLLRRL
jgi:hypothetical protein